MSKPDVDPLAAGCAAVLGGLLAACVAGSLLGLAGAVAYTVFHWLT